MDIEVRNENWCHIDNDEQTIYVIVSKSFKLQIQHRNIDTHTMIMHIKEFFIRLVELRGIRLLGNYFVVRWQKGSFTCVF